MSRTRWILLALSATGSALVSAAEPLPWQIIANNGTQAPGAPPGDLFRSYNPPGLNDQGVVVFRARSAALGNPQAGGL